MQTVTEALRLLQHLAKLERMMYSPRGNWITEEQELLAIKARLEILPFSVRAVLDTSERLHRPVEALSVEDVEISERGIH